MSNIPLNDLRELRVGNLLHHPEIGVITITAFTIYRIERRLKQNNPLSYSSIPISEEWLERTNIKDVIPEYNNAVISLEETDNGYIFELDIPRSGFYKISREMKYLHDLQNVVKEVFGTELTLKQ